MTTKITCRFCKKEVVGEDDEFEFHTDCADIAIEKAFFNKK